MKKLVILVLLVPMLALTMISCDADMRSNLAGWMGGFNGNVYADAGFIVPNTAQAEAAAATIAAIGTGDVDATSSGLGVTLTTAPPAGTKMLAPQSKAEQDKLKNNLADAFNSDTQKKKLLEDLNKPINNDNGQIDAANGTILVFNQTLTDLAASLPSGSDFAETLDKLKLPNLGDNPTQGDLLALQLMTNLISNTVATLKELGGGTLDGADNATLGDLDNKDKVLSIIDDALFAAEVAEQISGAGSIDFTGQIKLGDLLSSLDNKGSRSSGNDIDLAEMEDFLSTINGLAPSIVKLMGVTRNGTLYTYTPSKYKSFLLNQQIYRSSMEQALKMMSLGNLSKKDIDSLTFDTSTLVKYALAVFITEHDAFWESEKKKDSSAEAPYLIIAKYLNDSPGNKKLGLGTLTKTDVLTQPTGIIGFDYESWPTFLHDGTAEYPRDKAYYQAIISNIIMLNDFGGIAQLSTELKKDFYDPDNPSSTDGLSEWFDDLEDVK